nr:MAG TPA: hypothetical protein [Caudoviricetes sp.]
MATAKTARTAQSRTATTAKAVVISAFTGLKEDERVFMPGDVFEGTKTRVSELRKGGYLSEEDA